MSATDYAVTPFPVVALLLPERHCVYGPAMYCHTVVLRARRLAVESQDNIGAANPGGLSASLLAKTASRADKIGVSARLCHAARVHEAFPQMRDGAERECADDGAVEDSMPTARQSWPICIGLKGMRMQVKRLRDSVCACTVL